MMPNDKAARRPLIDPLLLALKSRRVLVALASLAAGLLVAAIPELAAIRGELLTLLVALALGLIGGYSLEDAAVAGRTAPPAQELREALKDALGALIDELLAAEGGEDEVA
jgi:hypothetical protein